MSTPTQLLVLDDESPLVTALLSTLRENGYEAAGATTPTGALALLQSRRFDVLLTDLNLPEMDGIAVMRAARAVDPALITIVMTGHGSIDTAVDAMKSGAADYLLKPFKMRTVHAVINRALGERALRLENEGLQRRLTARTHELEMMNKELEAFSYSVSHDLRAPLRAMATYADYLLEEMGNGEPADLRDYAQRIRRSAERMSGMIDDLLRMGRAFRKSLEAGPVNLTACCHDITQRLGTARPERRVDWTIPDQMRITADPGLITIAMENLLDNAWKYTARQDVAQIGVQLSCANNEFIVAVSDNGVGFDMAETAQLFAPFSRLKSAATFDGTGIGLATVQRIVHRHGGRIWAESSPGKGATFSFTLPQPGAQGAPASPTPNSP